MKASKFLASAFGVAVAAAVITGSQPARAEFPEQPVEMTVLFGGSAQTIAQLLADLMSKELGQPVVAVSRPGGGGAVGYSYTASMAPDGYNIVWNSNSISTSHHQGNLEVNYEAFDPIARVSLEVPVLAVNAQSGWETLADLVEGAKAAGRPLRVGVSGFGSFTHLTSAALFDRLGLTDVVYVPYGEGRAPAELLGQRVDAAVQWPSQFTSHAKAGTLNILCVTSAEPIQALPDTPTCSEAGAEGLDVTMWRGLAAPAGTPPEVVAKLEAAAQAAVQSEAFVEASKNLGFEPAFLGSEEFGALIAEDDKQISTLMGELGLKQE